MFSTRTPHTRVSKVSSPKWRWVCCCDLKSIPFKLSIFRFSLSVCAEKIRFRQIRSPSGRNQYASRSMLQRFSGPASSCPRAKVLKRTPASRSLTQRAAADTAMMLCEPVADLLLIFPADLPASSLQYQCGSVDFLCSPPLAKKGQTPRQCQDRPAVKPRPQPSTSPRPPTAQKPQGEPA